MSLFGSLFSGVSGLAAQGRAMSMISDNVSNVNTTAYRAAVAQFSSLVTQAGGAQYNAGGVRAITTYNVTSQGLIQASNSPTHAALSGAGFFVVNALADGAGDQLYTRAGSFAPDFLGNLRTPSGHFLQGWLLDADERILDINNVQTVNVRVISGLAAATTGVRLGANLDADQEVHAGAYAVGDMAAWEASGGGSGVRPHFTRAVQVYDSLGRPHPVTVAFLRTPGTNSWALEILAKPGEVTAASHPDGLLASGSFTFNGDGSLADATITPLVAVAGDAQAIGIDWLDGDGAANSAITFDFGNPGETNGLTQFASPSTVAFVTQNGAEVGQLNGVRIDEDGYVIASFTNGQERRIYKLPIASFPNPAALEPRTGNVYAQTDHSGEYNLSEAGRGGAGTITPWALESSNIDLAEEFTKMIVTQRAYSASARIITTTDEMLDELMRIKR